MSELTIKRDYFDAVKNDFIKIGNVKEGEFLREAGFAIQQINKNPQLSRCSKVSLLGSVLSVAQTGLTLNPVMKDAYLIPRWSRDNNCMEAILEPSYMGLINLLVESGCVNSIRANVVYDGDEFEWKETERGIVMTHKPSYSIGNKKGKPIAVWSLARLIDSTLHGEIMSWEEVMEIRELSESYKAMMEGKIRSCIWVSSEGEMAKKTVIKRHYKRLPKTQKMIKVASAIDLDNQLNGFRDKVDYGILDYAQGMIDNCTLDEDQKIEAERELNGCEYKDQVRKIIEKLRSLQLDPVTEGTITSMKQINDKVQDMGESEQKGGEVKRYYSKCCKKELTETDILIGECPNCKKGVVIIDEEHKVVEFN